MEKIKKEELIEMLGGLSLSDEELEEISGGVDWKCMGECLQAYDPEHRSENIPYVVECYRKCS